MSSSASASSYAANSPPHRPLCRRANFDRGRWFLPNITDDDHGKDKPVAYQGHRQHALDCVVETFRLVSNFDCTNQSPNKKTQPSLIATKRSFVTEIQTLLDPRKRQQETTKLIDSVKISHR